MAKGAELVAGRCPAHTMYVRLSPDLMAQSLDWTKALHHAFGQAVHQLCDTVVRHVLNGLAITSQPNAMRVPAGWIEFAVTCRGTRIIIVVFGFEGPEAPGPKGGTWQPRPADERVLGLRGTGKDFTIVTFYGPLPPVPVENTIRGPWKSVILVNLPENGNDDFHSRQRSIAVIMRKPTGFRTANPHATRQSSWLHRNLASVAKLASREEANKSYINFALTGPRSTLQSRHDRSMRRKLPSFAALDLDSTALLPRYLHRPPFDCRLDLAGPSSGDAGMRLH